MKSSANKEVLEKIAQARKNWADQLPEKIKEIEQTWSRLIKAWDDSLLDVLLRQLHTLAGSGGTFGFPEVSDDSRTAHKLLQKHSAAGGQLSATQKKEIDKKLQLLYQTTGEALQKGPPVFEEELALETTESSPNTESKKIIFLVDDDVSLADELMRHLGYYGYTVQHFTTFKKFKGAVLKNRPAIVIMDIELPDATGTTALAAFQKELPQPLTTFFISAQGDIEARLGAVRAGGEAFFEKPLDFPLIIDVLDSITAGQDPNPYRIMIVEDSTSLAEYNALLLQKAGMDVKIVTNPLEILSPLEEYQPDLVLLDLYMPDCSGVELARIIRQQESFVSIPIVYLSEEMDIEKQLKAMSIGGDEFLNKTILPEHLVLSISSRAKRSRILRSYMIKDSLTGLLNHTKIKEQLTLLTARAIRSNDPLSFAMVDIDHFKSVNDTYGHPAGDRVIKSLSRLLKKRLRKTDIIGRYGGEEFAVILSGTRGEIARKIMDELRLSFTSIGHQSEEKVFYSSFSCGVVELRPELDAAQLNELADQALYQAKESGRNKVVLKEFN